MFDKLLRKDVQGMKAGRGFFPVKTLKWIGAG
jgi:hypothetical protein